ncbi:MAG: Nif3-like dinuclear metal center hexameric protein [Chloroflexi bacterium]|nr:MAG: Nif3-like dinuclear metal center hexameric protein [Chloroflexota bacterium]
MKRDELTNYLDEYLKISEIEDRSKNGLQVEGPEEVQRVAFAVDCSLAGFDEAVRLGADLLIVHHGLFWGDVQVLTGPLFRRVRALIEGNVGLYAAHLPLDAHEEVGNNVQLARLLELEITGPFGEHRGSSIGVAGRPVAGSVTRQAFVERVNSRLDTQCVVQPHGPAEIRTVAIVSGGAAGMIDQAARAGFDLYLTGETSHSYAHAAEEYGINVVFAGHYATETVGLKALARHLEGKFGLETAFIDLPTGM